MTRPLIAIRDVGETEADDTLYPLVSDYGDCVFESDGSVIWEGDAKLEQYVRGPEAWERIWELPSRAYVAVTSSQIMNLCRRLGHHRVPTNATTAQTARTSTRIREETAPS